MALCLCLALGVLPASAVAGTSAQGETALDQALNGEEEKKENGIEFRPFYPETENRPEITYNLDLFGGIFTQMYNTQNNI